MNIKEESSDDKQLKRRDQVPKIGATNQISIRSSIPVMSTKHFLENANLEKSDSMVN